MKNEMTNEMIDTKKIILTTENTNQNTSSKKIVREKKEPKKRVEPQKWKLESSEFCNFENQIELIHQIKNNNYLATDNYNSKLIKRQIERKISGYKQQDILKDILVLEKLIQFPQIIDAFIQHEFKCYYCKANMYILYDMVRETLQWTVDRIDNDLGHNSDNFILACLGCNLKRRCRTKDKFLFTKQLVIVKSPLLEKVEQNN
jgi:hypothetical protein